MMKKISLSIMIFFIAILIKSQTITTQRISDWNNLKYSGFYESLGGTNLPVAASWHWGINIGHTLNTNTSSKYSFGAQILFPVVGINMELPKMYIRSTNIEGLGTWAKVLIDKGDQSINGNLSVSNNIIADKNIEVNDNSMLGRNLSNNFTYDGKPMGHYALRWGDDSSTTTWGPSLWQSAYGGMKFFTKGTLRMTLHADGNVGIGTGQPQNKLDVAGTIRATDNIYANRNIEINHNSILGRNLSNNFVYDGKPMGHYALRWGDDSSTTTWGPSLWQSAYGGMKFFTKGSLRMTLHANGNVGIGTENPQNKLEVNGTIRATEVKVETGWADFVFDKDYKLPSLKYVESHIEEHKHLPGIPSEAEVKESKGVRLGEMQVKLLQKIEELTLYVIEQNKKIDQQDRRIQELEKTSK